MSAEPTRPDAPRADAPCADEAAWAALNEYADGELEPADAPALFAHLAGCPACRADFDALLDLRRSLRAEPFVLPPAADAALFVRLGGLHRASGEIRRARHRRAPLARALGHRVSVGASLGAALVILAAAAAGLSLVDHPDPPPALIQTVDGQGTVFVLDRAMTVEAKRDPGGGG